MLPRASILEAILGPFSIKNVIKNKSNIGILICGSGMGMTMSANKHKKIRAALCYSPKNAKLSRLHNDANVITLGGILTS